MFSKAIISAFREKETPFYYYDLDLLAATLKALKSASARTDYEMHYAVKANANPEILNMISAHGFGARNEDAQGFQHKSKFRDPE
jgi:diaminopimelate decarboxylase